MTNSSRSEKVRIAALAGIMGLMAVALLAGCKSKEQAAIDQAKAQAASTGVAQQIQYIDANGDTETITVAPPVAGQVQQVTTAITPAPPGPKPKRTNPVVSPYGQAPAPVAGTAAPGAYDPGAPAVPAQQGLVSNASNGPNDSPYVAPPDAPLTANAPSVNVRVPAGTSLAIRINQHISVKHNQAGDRFSGEVVEPIEVDGRVVIPRGAHVGGRVVQAHRRGHFKGRSVLGLTLTSIELNGNRYPLDTQGNVRSKKGKGRRTGGWIGGMTGAGMLIGGLASGGVGLAIGGAAGAGAGTLIAGTTGNRDIEIPAETVMRFKLADSLYIQ